MTTPAPESRERDGVPACPGAALQWVNDNGWHHAVTATGMSMYWPLHPGEMERRAAEGIGNEGAEWTPTWQQPNCRELERLAAALAAAQAREARLAEALEAGVQLLQDLPGWCPRECGKRECRQCRIERVYKLMSGALHPQGGDGEGGGEVNDPERERLLRDAAHGEIGGGD